MGARFCAYAAPFAMKTGLDRIKQLTPFDLQAHGVAWLQPGQCVSFQLPFPLQLAWVCAGQDGNSAWVCAGQDGNSGAAPSRSRALLSS